MILQRKRFVPAIDRSSVKARLSTRLLVDPWIHVIRTQHTLVLPRVLQLEIEMTVTRETKTETETEIETEIETETETKTEREREGGGRFRFLYR